VVDRLSLSTLDDVQRQQALDRFHIIRPFLEDGVPLTHLAAAQRVPLRTLQRWVRQYREQGLVGLARQPRTDRGQRRIPTDLQQLIEGLALQQPPPTVATIHRLIVAVATEHGWPVPGYDTVRQVIQALEPALITLAQQGSQAYQQAFDLLYQRQATQPNAIWQADHTLLDIWVLDEDNQARRPWLTVIEDDYSRCIAGYLLSFAHPNTLHTALALRQAIWYKDNPDWRICGIPEVFYTDHGSDFTSRHMEQVSADLKIQLVFSTPGMPRGRGRVERFFRSVNQLCLCELPGFTADGSAPVSTPTLTLDELDVLFRHFVVQLYHLRPHSTTGVAPQALWEAGGFLPHMPESLEQLDLLLLTVARTRHVHRDGIRFHTYRYFDLNLAAYIGEEVVIRYDPRDMAEIWVYCDNQLICRAICPELAGETASLKEVIRRRRAQKRDLKVIIRDRNELVERYLRVHHTETDDTAAETPDTTPAKLKRYRND
jgi:putative transposase